MPLVFADRVKETTNTIGSGTLALGGAVAAFQTFSAGVGVGNQCYYTITNDADNTWEVGIGTLIATGSLQRDSVLSSSNGGLAVAFVAGTKTVFATAPSEFFTNALSTTSHAGIDHTGLTGVNNFDVAAHSGTDHTGITGVLSVETFDQTAHSTEPHAGLPGIPVTATSGSGGATEGTVSADSDKGLQIVGGVMEAKLGSSLQFDGSGNIELASIGAGYTIPFFAAWNNLSTSNAAGNTWPIIVTYFQDGLTGGTVGAGADELDSSEIFPVSISGNLVRVVFYNLTTSQDSIIFDSGSSAIEAVVNGSPTGINLTSNITISSGATGVVELPTPIAVTAGDRLTFNLTGRTFGGSEDITLHVSAVVGF